MLDMLFPSNKRTSKNVALLILGLLLASNLGFLTMIGLPLTQWGVAGWSIVKILNVFGIAWVLVGIWKYKIV